MFGLTYLPEKELERQLKLQDELMSCRDPSRVEEIRKEVREIEAKRKPIIQCNIEETTELKTMLYKKLQSVSRVGKRGQAEQFTKMIRMLDDRIMVLHLEMQKENKEKMENTLKEKEDRVKEAKEVKRGIEEGRTKPKRRSSANRWTTGFGKVD